MRERLVRVLLVVVWSKASFLTAFGMTIVVAFAMTTTGSIEMPEMFSFGATCLVVSRMPWFLIFFGLAYTATLTDQVIVEKYFGLGNSLVFMTLVPSSFMTRSSRDLRCHACRVFVDGTSKSWPLISSGWSAMALAS
jgi:hypothetical protein